jgi:preprotein translocase subunit SecG
MTFFVYLTMSLFIAVCVLLILLILIQKGRGGGLASAFGGGGGSSAFGSKTGDVLTWATSIIFGIFLLLGIAMNLLANKYNEREISKAKAAYQLPTAPALPPLDQPLSSQSAGTPATAPTTAPAK